MTLPIQRVRSDEPSGGHMFAKAGTAPPAAARRGGDIGDIIDTDDPGLIHISPACIERLHGRLRAQTAECVMETFGISVKTWLKMRKGMPIRKSVAERLLQRVGADL